MYDEKTVEQVAAQADEPPMEEPGVPEEPTAVQAPMLQPVLDPSLLEHKLKDIEDRLEKIAQMQQLFVASGASIRDDSYDDTPLDAGGLGRDAKIVDFKPAEELDFRLK